MTKAKEDKETKKDKTLYYPLGGSVYGYVQTRGGQTKIHVRQFVYLPDKAKTIKTQKGLSMTLEQFKTLCRVKRSLCDDFGLKKNFACGV